MTTRPSADLIHRAPKALLHDHLDGGLRPQTVLDLAQDHAFARRLVNSGRLSVPSFLTASALNTPDADDFAGDMVPGAPMDDAPVQINGVSAWLLDQVGKGFQLMLFADDTGAVDGGTQALLKELAANALPVTPLVVTPAGGKMDGIAALADPQGHIHRRYDARPGTVYLLRPDQHVAARWRTLDAAQVRAALGRATCNA